MTHKSIDHGNFENASLFGMTCDGRDIIAQNIALPKDLQVGDWLCLDGMGAYTHGTKSNFNGMESTTKVHILQPEVKKQEITESEHHEPRYIPLGI